MLEYIYTYIYYAFNHRNLVGTLKLLKLPTGSHRKSQLPTATPTLHRLHQQLDSRNVDTANLAGGQADTRTDHDITKLTWGGFEEVSKISPKLPSVKGIYHWRDPFITSMIMGGRVCGSRHRFRSKKHVGQR